MSRQPLRAVIFDYGHTLLDVRWDDGARERGERRLLAELGDPVGRGPFHAAVESELARAQSAAGEHAEVDYPRVAAAALRRLAVVPDPAALERGIRCEVLGSAEVRFPHPQAAGVLRELRRMGLRLAIVSNTPDPPPLVLELIEGDGLGELVDAILLSSALGLRKPAPAVYAAALEAVGAEPGETLFVGDRVEEDVRGPAAAGMRTCLATWYRSEERGAAEADFTAASPVAVVTLARHLCGGDEPHRPGLGAARGGR